MIAGYRILYVVCKCSLVFSTVPLFDRDHEVGPHAARAVEPGERPALGNMPMVEGVQNELYVWIQILEVVAPIFLDDIRLNLLGDRVIDFHDGAWQKISALVRHHT